MRRISRPKVATRLSAALRAFRVGAIVMAIMVGLSGCQAGYAGKMETINFGAINAGPATLVYIAQDQHFFADNGLSVNIKDSYATGVATTDALLKGDVDIAWTAELPMVRRAFEKQPIRIIASVGRASEGYLFCRTDRGVVTIADLKGGKIGVPRNTIAEFWLMRFLALNGVNPQDVTLVDLQPAQAPEEITNESLEGIVTWEPWSSQIRQQHSDKISVWSIQSSQPGYWVIVARNNWIATSPEITNRFLMSLAQAEDYLNHNPAAAKAIVQKRMGLDDTLMQSIWTEDQFFLSLDQSLILAMEDEARWMIKNNLTTEKQVPNFLDYIWEDALKAIKPDAVNIVR